MSAGFDKVGFLLACSVALAGCRGELAPVPLDADVTEATADVGDLAEVLAKAVTSDGRVKASEAKRLAVLLDSQLRKLAAAGPTITPQLYPTAPSRWAYWYNARAAWSVKLAAVEGFRERIGCQEVRDRRFRLDGRTMCLSRIDQILLDEARRTGDFRLAVCAPGICADYAPMPPTPFSAKDFTSRLGPALDSLVLDERRFVLDVAAKQVVAPRMLWSCRDLIIREYRQEYGAGETSLVTALRPHLGTSAQRRLHEALGYAVVPPGPGFHPLVPKRKIYYPGKVGRIEP